MDRNAFFNLIKENRLSGAYLLHGEEEYVKDSAVSSVLATVEEATRALNVDTLESAEANALMLACDALPFFAERRVVICRAMPKDSDAKALLAYLPKMPATTLLLFLLRRVCLRQLERRQAALPCWISHGLENGGYQVVRKSFCPAPPRGQFDPSASQPDRWSWPYIPAWLSAGRLSAKCCSDMRHFAERLPAGNRFAG